MIVFPRLVGITTSAFLPKTFTKMSPAAYSQTSVDATLINNLRTSPAMISKRRGSRLCWKRKFLERGRIHLCNPRPVIFIYTAIRTPVASPYFAIVPPCRSFTSSHLHSLVYSIPGTFWVVWVARHIASKFVEWKVPMLPGLH